MPEPRKHRDVGASVRARLLNLANQKGQPFDLLLTRYGIERLLHRLSLSPYRDHFVLKGAMLMATWFNDPTRVRFASSLSSARIALMSCLAEAVSRMKSKLPACAFIASPSVETMTSSASNRIASAALRGEVVSTTMLPKPVDALTSNDWVPTAQFADGPACSVSIRD